MGQDCDARLRRVSACASLHDRHWDWHSGRICTVVYIAHGGEWDSYRPSALTDLGTLPSGKAERITSLSPAIALLQKLANVARARKRVREIEPDFER